MAKEIERKFLIDTNLDMYLKCAYANSSLGNPVLLKQGYLVDFKNRTLRVRVSSEGSSKLTYKGPTTGITRTEIEFGIPVFIGNLLLKLCSKVLRKTRRKLPTIETCNNVAETYWEIDEFHNLGETLFLAELELPTEDTYFVKPEWLGREVSHDPAYYNSSLIKKVV